MASRRDAVGPMVERILRAVAPGGFDEDRRTDLAVALSEALSNAAVHGHGLDSRRRVAVTVEVEPGRAVVEVTDRGRGFDAGGVGDPTEDERKLLSGGRGIFLMRRLVDRVEYNESGNTVRLTVLQPPTSAHR
jgi:serine/threonine-protein kinase RsbW